MFNPPKITVSWSSKPVSIPGVPIKDYQKEYAFQTSCADWLRKQYKLSGNKLFKWWHHSANERIGVREGFKAKMMGQGKGFPDFVHCGLKLAFELKVKGNDTEKVQDEWLEYFKSIGWMTEVVYTFERFKELVLEAVAREEINIRK